MGTPPAICGRAICGRTICGQVDIDEIFEDKSVSFSDHGENPKINLSTGRLMYEQADLSVGGGNYAIEISHIYNSNQAVGLLRCGVGWKLNVYQRLISKDDGTYKYIDGSGGVNTFVLFDSANSRYYNTIDAGQVLTIVDGRASITDGIGNKINFNENGYVVSVVSALNANIKKIFEYDTSGNLVKIYDARLKFSDKIKTYITFEYDHITGLMTSISAYDKYTRLVDRYVYEYDNGYLVEIYHVAINSLGEELTRKCIKRFSYNSEGKLSSIVDTETRSASVFTYAGNRVSKVDFGVINDQAAVGVQLGELAQLGLTDGNGNVMNIGQAVENRSSNAIYLSGGLYVSKGTNQYSYTISNNTQKVCETVITNDKGVKLSYFIDTKNRIISQFEKATDAHRKTLKLESGKILALNNYVTLTSSGEQINGRTTYRANNLTVDINENFNISHYENYDNKYYECSFWLKHNYDVERLKIKFVYTIANSLTITKYVWINGRACDAWQKVNVLMELPNRNGGGFASDALNKLVITLCDVSGNNKGDFTLSSLLFNPAPKVTFNVSNANGDLPLEYVESIALTCQTTNYMVDQQGSALYMMENDVLKTYMGRYAQPVVINGVTYFDVICNDGTKRLPRVNAMTGYYQNIGFDLTSYNVPVVMQTIMPTDKVRITQRYQFGASSFTLASTNEYDENCFSVTNENGIVTHSTTNNEVYNYKGQKLSSKDEYDVTTQYSYDDLGKLIQTKTIGKDGLIGEISDVHYDENEENVKTASNGYSSTDFTYVSPFAITRETIENSYNTDLNVYSNSSNKKVTTYDIYNNRISKVSQYNGASKVAENSVTYENGRIRTVSNGYVKYGAKHDFVNDRMEYTRFSGNTETVVQTDTITRSDIGENHTSTFSAGSDTTLKTTLDKYNRISSVSGNNTVSYEYQNGNESTVAQKLTSIVDGYEDRTTVYHYDAYDNLYGWTKGTNHLTVEQITGGDTKYTFGANEKYYTHVNYDANMVMSPRIASTGISRDPDNDSDDDVKEFAEYRKYYEYDSLGRTVKKSIDDHTYQTYDYLKVGDSNTTIPSKTIFSQYQRKSIFNGYDDYRVGAGEEYKYDAKGNLTQIQLSVNANKMCTIYNAYTSPTYTTETYVREQWNRAYEYDDCNRITKETISKVENGTTITTTNTYTYGANGKLSSASLGGQSYTVSYNPHDQIMSYKGNTYIYDNMGNRKKKMKNGVSTIYSYTRGNLLSRIGSSNYYYNADCVRYKKEVNDVTTTYYLDGNKILGEDRVDNNGNVTKLRYFYDIDGLCGIRYNKVNYKVVRNAYGDIIAILKEHKLVAYYHYDMWGNCEVKTLDGDDIGNINPFRWKGHYYDVESGLYYANGSYYDPEVGLHVDASEISSIIDNAFTLFGLDRNGIMCDNILAYLPNAYAIFTTRELSVDPLKCIDLDEHWDKSAFWTIAAIVVATVAGVVLTIFSGGIAGAVMAGALLGFSMSSATSLIAQVSQKGWDGVDYDEVWIEGAIGAGIGALSGFFSYGMAEVASMYGKQMGIAFSQTSHIGTGIIFGKVFGMSTLMTIGSGMGRVIGTLSGAIFGDYFGSELLGRGYSLFEKINELIINNIFSLIKDFIKWAL